jgi:hypothetical protein
MNILVFSFTELFLYSFHCVIFQTQQRSLKIKDQKHKAEVKNKKKWISKKKEQQRVLVNKKKTGNVSVT